MSFCLLPLACFQILQLRASTTPLTAAELQLMERLQALVRTLKLGSAELPRRADAVLSAAQAEDWTLWGPALGLSSSLDAISSDRLLKVIGSQSDAIMKLVNTAKLDSKHLQVMLHRLSTRMQGY